MAVRLIPAETRTSIQALAPIIWPQPPGLRCPYAAGFRRQAGQFVLTEHGAALAAVAQRIFLAWALDLESRDALARRYCYSGRQVQAISLGHSLAHLTRPVRERLTELGLTGFRDRRTPEGRARLASVNRRLAARAADALWHPGLYSEAERESLALDLYILSGAWREELE